MAVATHPVTAREPLISGHWSLKGASWFQCVDVIGAIDCRAWALRGIDT